MFKPPLVSILFLLLTLKRMLRLTLNDVLKFHPCLDKLHSFSNNAPSFLNSYGVTKTLAMAKMFLFLILLHFIAITAFSQEITRQDADSLLRALNKSKADIHRIDLLLSLAQFHIFKPGENQIDFDSATAYINQAAALNKSVESSSAYGFLLLSQSYLMKEKGQKEDAKKLAEKAVAILETGSNKYYLGRAYYELSMHFRWDDRRELSRRISLVERAINSFKQAGKLESNAFSLEMLGDLYSKNEEGKKAIEALTQALAAYQKTNYQKLQGVYVLLGEEYLSQGDGRQALSYLLKALKTAHSLHDTTMQLCQINNILGSLYSRVDRLETAIFYYRNGMQIAQKHHDVKAVVLIGTNIASMYNNVHQSDSALEVLGLLPASILKAKVPFEKSLYAKEYLRTYIALKRYDLAQPYRDTVLNLAEMPEHGYFNRSHMYRVLANYYLDTKQYSRAEYFLKKNLDLSKKSNFEMGIIHGSRLWYKLDSIKGNYRAAFNHLLFNRTKMDSIFSVNRMKQLQVIGVEYEVEMKEDSIKRKDQDIALLTQRNSLQQANLRQASFIRNVTIAGIISSFIIIGFIYRQYRQKQKSNEVISRKNEQLQHLLSEKEWLLKEIHHRVKNNLQLVMSLLNSQIVFVDNPYALTAIHDSQHRVHAMALIHQKLYGSENVSSIDMSVYIRELVSYLADSFNTGQRIRFAYHIDPLELDVSQAVPVGLILNEAITNSIKYAFPNSKDGVISISLNARDSQRCFLVISDDGIGITRDLNDRKAGSLGMTLMQGLSEDLDGNFSIENKNGTAIKISFVPDLRNKPLVPSNPSIVLNN